MAWRCPSLKPTSLWMSRQAVDPAQRVSADVELTGVITDDNGVTEVSMIDHAAPQRPFGGDLHRIGVDL